MQSYQLVLVYLQHFVCAQCEKPFLGTRHYEKKGLAYCEIHYHQLFGNICFVCNSIINGDGECRRGRGSGELGRNGKTFVDVIMILFFLYHVCKDISFYFEYMY